MEGTVYNSGLSRRSDKVNAKYTEGSSDMKQKSLYILTAFGVLAALIVGGCTEPEPRQELVITVHPPISLPLAQYRIVGNSVLNRPVVSTTVGQGPDVIFVLATIHGDEAAGTRLVRYLGSYLRERPDMLTGRAVVLLPVANPDGMAAATRHNANDVDVNRNFAAANRLNSDHFGHRPLCEPEAQAIERLIQQHRPDRIVSVHQRNPGLPACIDYDGPGQSLASRMAQHCDLPVKQLGAKPGSLGSYAGNTLGIPTITFEMHRSDSGLTAEQLWRRYGKALLAAIVYPGTLP
jgi:protein MpaA